MDFRDIAVWTAGSRAKSIDFNLDGPNAVADNLLLDERNSLYAFVYVDEVKYIGKTARTIRERFVGYKNPPQRQRTNWRCHGKIREMLEGGDLIRILVFNPISRLRYGDFDINLAAGLEDSLIAEFSPPWNGSQRLQAITEEAEREAAEDASTPVDDSSVVTASAATSGSGDGSSTASISLFRIILGEAYYTQGIINPGVDASSHLGKDGDPNTITFSDRSEPIISRIDRRANKSGSVRVVGHNRLVAKWFQKNFNKGDTVDARVVGQNQIFLVSPAARD